MLGVAGCRVGYIATNNMFLNQLLFQQNWKDLAGVSTLSQNLIIDILKKLDLDRFMARGNLHLCYAREEMQKISYLFDNQPINSVGMFYCVKTTPKMMDFVTDCGIQYTELDRETIRLSMGNTLTLTKEAVKRMIKKDKV
jgi:aspartate/methionine/tyrosine aminotransferase